MEPLFENKAQFMENTSGDDRAVKWLTCTDVTSADYPWSEDFEAGDNFREEREHGQRRLPADPEDYEDEDENDSSEEEGDVEMDDSRRNDNTSRQQEQHYSNRRQSRAENNYDTDSDTERVRYHWRRTHEKDAHVEEEELEKEELEEEEFEDDDQPGWLDRENSQQGGEDLDMEEV